MYDPIFSKSFSRTERKRFGSCAIFLCFIIALGISSSLKPHLQLLSLIGDAVKTQLSINAVGNMLVVDDGTRGNIKPIVLNPAEYLQFPSDAAAQNKLIVNHTTIITSTYSGNANKMEQKHAIMCRNSNYCEIEGDIRIEGKSSTILVVSISSQSTESWSVEPYPRKGTSRVKKWRMKLVPHDENVPKCTQHHTDPAILFSMGGFAGNYFHDFADVLFPLYLTSSEFKGEAQFVATDHKPWWISKFKNILSKLTKHNILDIDGETSQVHCYNKMRIGLKFHKELMTNPALSKTSPSMQAFRLLLREAYSLRRESTIDGAGPGPRLMIIDRKHTRVLTNKRQVSRVARKMGFEVVEGAVNSCDVLVGVHGAGLTNMVFLPDDAVVIQVVPFGNVDGFARLDFANPAAGMGLRYLEYKIGAKESSLSRKYSKDHRILRNPESYVHWDQVWSIYLNQQNVTLDLRRFKPTLAKALKLLRR